MGGGGIPGNSGQNKDAQRAGWRSLTTFPWVLAFDHNRWHDNDAGLDDWSWNSELKLMTQYIRTVTLNMDYYA